jgi:hypothetical protein
MDQENVVVASAEKAPRSNFFWQTDPETKNRSGGSSKFEEKSCLFNCHIPVLHSYASFPRLKVVWQMGFSL